MNDSPLDSCGCVLRFAPTAALIAATSLARLRRAPPTLSLRLVGARSGHVTFGHVALGHVSLGHVALGHVALGHVTLGHVALGHVTFGHVALGQPFERRRGDEGVVARGDAEGSRAEGETAA